MGLCDIKFRVRFAILGGMVQVIFTGPIVYQYTDQGKLGGTDLVPDSIFSFPAFFF